LREFCNVTYAFLAKGRDEKQLLELDAALDPSPVSAEVARERANMEAMKQFQAMMPAPPRSPRG
jgi:hypothetical protein